MITLHRRSCQRRSLPRLVTPSSRASSSQANERQREGRRQLQAGQGSPGPGEQAGVGAGGAQGRPQTSSPLRWGGSPHPPLLGDTAARPQPLGTHHPSCPCRRGEEKGARRCSAMGHQLKGPPQPVGTRSRGCQEQGRSSQHRSDCRTCPRILEIRISGGSRSVDPRALQEGKSSGGWQGSLGQAGHPRAGRAPQNGQGSPGHPCKHARRWSRADAAGSAAHRCQPTPFDLPASRQLSEVASSLPGWALKVH